MSGSAWESDTPNRPPLWRMMHNAYLHSPISGPRGHLGFAAEIRALAKWIRQRQIEDYGKVLPDFQELLGALATEAERAEAGDAAD